MQALTIAVCTLNRPADLERCIRSVVAAEFPDDLSAVEVLVIDDGHLAEPEVRKLERLVSEAGRVFSYLRNTAQHGLIHGRMAAIQNAISDVLLFLDDDVEIERGYLRLLVNWYRAHPETAGLGGVDTLTKMFPTVKRVLARLFLQDSGQPGRLSLSGFS